MRQIDSIHDSIDYPDLLSTSGKRRPVRDQRGAVLPRFEFNLAACFLSEVAEYQVYSSYFQLFFP